MSSECIVGVDFGATNIRAGVCSKSGEVLSLARQSTDLDDGIEDVLRRIGELVKQAITMSRIPPKRVKGVAVGACGLVDGVAGTLICSAVLPGWHNVPLASIIGSHVEIPVAIYNDANSAIYGEWFAGIARGLRHVVGLTLGTGIGGAAILDAKLYQGAVGLSGEFGHLTVDPQGPECNCGNRGCLGLVAGARGVVQRYRKKAEESGRAILGTCEASTVFGNAALGDEFAIEVVDETARYLGIGVGNVLSCFNPEMVVFTGGMTGAGDALLTAIRREAQSRTYAPIFDAARIEFGVLGEAAAVVGAAGILFDSRSST
jgi:glucokinase